MDFWREYGSENTLILDWPPQNCKIIFFIILSHQTCGNITEAQ